MKSITRWRLLRALAVLSAAAFAITGSVVAGPAQAAAPGVGLAAEEEQHCVLVLPTEFLRCFATPEEADKFAADAKVGPPKQQPGTLSPGSAATVDAASAGPAQAVPLTLLSREYTLPFFVGSSLRVYGLNGPCTTPTGNIDYQLSSMPAGWNNVISSFQTFSNCWARHYDLTNFVAPFVGYTGSQAVIGGGLDNDTSSMRWS